MAFVMFTAWAWSTQSAWAVTTCSATVTTLDFGSVGDVTQSTQGAATLTVTCNTTALSLLANTKVRMCINIGKAVRDMPNAAIAGAALSYQLYKDASRTLIWGSSTTAAPANQPLIIDLDYPVLVLVGGSGAVTRTLYGQIPAQANAAAGNYLHSYSAADTSVVFQSNSSLLGPASPPATCTSGGEAGTPTNFSFDVKANIPPSCDVLSASNLQFGSNAGAITAPLDNASSVALTCRRGTAWTLGLDDGQNFSGGTRRMRKGTSTDFVAYQLYRDSGRTTPWSTTGAGVATGTGTGTSMPQAVYGRVPAPQNVPAGEYLDVVTVTVTY
ncbi:hypothetical protein AX767_07775 [Variovorax sp. PAMC 28711]|nr:hypothetical protein AX767_07775 [Variovorax sp. PAMC 28711]